MELIDIRLKSDERLNENAPFETAHKNPNKGAYEQSIDEEQKDAEAVDDGGQINDPPIYTNEPILEEREDNNIVNEETNEDKNMKERIAKYVQIIIRLTRSVKNKFIYSFKEIFNHLTVGKLSARDKIVNFYHKKIMKKFNIFNYLKKIKTLKIIKKTLLKEEQIQVIGLKACKEYDVDFNEKMHDRKTTKEKDSQILNNFMDNYNPKEESPKQNLLNYLVLNDN